MWDNPRILNLAAGVLIGLTILASGAAGGWLLLHSALFPLRELDVTTALRKTTKAEVEAALRGRITGNFFAISPDEVRTALEGLPWVRRASVRRVWPDRLEAELEEQTALARWGDDALVNAYGERFSARSNAALPLFVGPEGTEHEMAARYARFAAIVAPLGTGLERVVLTPRFAWQLRLSGGLEIMLGRNADAAEARLRRFVGVYDATLKTLPGTHGYVDLRYANGFALRVPDLKG
jgi:cell division protein FtsQ